MDLNSSLPGDNLVEWKKRDNEPFMDYFNKEDWLHIFSDVTNAQQLEDFMNIDCGQCFVAHNLVTHKPFGFIYVYTEDEKTRKVSVHGGSWLPNHTLLNYRAYVLMLDWLFEQGFKVRTSCQLDNEKAMRFDRSIGFVKYYTSPNYHYLWIDEKRLHSSKIYKRLIGVDK